VGIGHRAPFVNVESVCTHTLSHSLLSLYHSPSCWVQGRTGCGGGRVGNRYRSEFSRGGGPWRNRYRTDFRMRFTVRGALVHILDERFRAEGHVVRFCLCLAAMPNMRLSESERAAVAAGAEAARDVGDAITAPPPTAEPVRPLPAHSAHCTSPRQLPRCPGCAWLRMFERDVTPFFLARDSHAICCNNKLPGVSTSVWSAPKSWRPAFRKQTARARSTRRKVSARI
jgi:hypothetical protein